MLQGAVQTDTPDTPQEPTMSHALIHRNHGLRSSTLWVWRCLLRGMRFAAVIATLASSRDAVTAERLPSDAAIHECARATVPSLLKLYCHLHAHPELSLFEKETAARLAEEWKQVGFAVTTNVGGHGIVAILKNGPGPTVMLRTDLDGLPIVEQTLLPYASHVKVQDEAGNDVGTMHACGHDIHMASLAGAAQYLATHKDQWQGTLMLIGQPAEERVMGAKAMLQDGLFTRFPKPDIAIAMHCDAALAAGMVGCRAGYALANTDTVDVTLYGKGGHGAYPHTTIDPIVEAAQFIVAVQTIVSREVKPTDPAVVTIGSIHGGTKHNIISDECHLQLTLRSYTDDVRKQLIQAVERKARGIAQAAGATEPKIVVSQGTPALYNDDRLNAQVEKTLRRVLGENRVTLAEQSMGGEDFSRFGEAGVPVLMFRLGTIQPQRLDQMIQRGQTPPSLHSAHFYPDPEPTLETGMVAMVTIALDLMPKQ